jgi:hypothetical protein
MEVKKMVSKEDREAYEDGEEEADFIRDHPLSFMLTGGIHDRPSDSSEAAAYDKGLRREQLDEDEDDDEDED